ncbi:hypothetical protein [Nostoc commune]|uniref:hypothetical protein n=1 Tax=Nostoc commune TaxID=1178 RepID=UPI0018C46F65|nr:hypothetical protein [Nostoc commune]
MIWNIYSFQDGRGLDSLQQLNLIMQTKFVYTRISAMSTTGYAYAITLRRGQGITSY